MSDITYPGLTGALARTDDANKKWADGGLFGALKNWRYYAGPHLSRAVDNAGQAAMAAANIFGPGADIKGMVEDSAATTEALRNRDWLGAVGSAGMAAAAVPMMFLPGSVKGVTKAAELPMDEASRMARAKAMGFDVDAYHGTGAAFRSFDPARLGAATDNVTTRMGFHFSPTPDEANRMARVFGGETANVLPVRIGLKNPYEMSWAEFEKIKMLEWDNRHLGDQARAVANQKADEILNGLKAAGHDGIVVTRKGLPSEYVVFDPQNIRSRFAAFDPEKADSSDLLASIAALLGAGGAGMLGAGGAEASPAPTL